MKILNYREKLLQLDQLIRLKATGTPCELARRLSVSESTLYNLLIIMRELADEQNAEIIFDYFSNSYYYPKDVKFYFGFELV